MTCLISLLAHGSFATSIDNSKLLPSVQKKYGVDAMKRFRTWRMLIINNKDKTTLQKLQSVNDFFNQFHYRGTQTLIGQEDYWMTPFEFLIKGQGACEDFAIAKYFTLKELGITDDNLQLVYVKAIKYNLAHMVLAYYETPSSDPLILDNLTNAILPGSARTDLIPIYSFNAEGLWLAKRRGMGEKVGNSQRLSAWQAVLDRMQKFLQDP